MSLGSSEAVGMVNSFYSTEERGVVLDCLPRDAFLSRVHVKIVALQSSSLSRCFVSTNRS